MKSGIRRSSVRLNRLGLGTGWSRARVLLSVALLALSGAVVLRFGSGASPVHAAAGGPATQPFALASAHPASRPPSPQIRASFRNLPLIFETNQGQSDSQVKFLAHGRGYGLFLTADGAVLKLQPSASSHPSANSIPVVRMALAGANPSAPLNGIGLLPGKSNYFIGNNPTQWHRNVPQFARVRYAGVYPGIDLVFYGNQGRLEYDFEIAPGADPKQVALRFQGSDNIKLNPAGDLVLPISGGEVKLEAPQVYQRVGDKNRPVSGRFALRGKDKVGFELGPYDRSRTLVIDPVLSYSSFLGGSGDEACSVIVLQYLDKFSSSARSSRNPHLQRQSLRYQILSPGYFPFAAHHRLLHLSRRRWRGYQRRHRGGQFFQCVPGWDDQLHQLSHHLDQRPTRSHRGRQPRFCQ
jgi:hypothetical protein